MYALRFIEALDQFREALMGDVVQLIRDPAEAWQAYCDLIAEQSADASLLRNVEHQLKIVRAWRRWAALVPNEES